MLWTKPEIDEYLKLKINYALLEDLYLKQDIKEDDVEKKSRYLVDILNLTMTDEDLLKRTTHDEGRAKGLIFLEDLVVSSHKNFIEKSKKEIDVSKL